MAKRMDHLSPSPFWIKKQQILVFDFSNVSNERCIDDSDEVVVGNYELSIIKYFV